MTPAERARHVARARERIAEQVRSWGHPLDDETAALLDVIDDLCAEVATLGWKLRQRRPGLSSEKIV